MGAVMEFHGKHFRQRGRFGSGPRCEDTAYEKSNLRVKMQDIGMFRSQLDVGGGSVEGMETTTGRENSTEECFANPSTESLSGSLGLYWGLDVTPKWTWPYGPGINLKHPQGTETPQVRRKKR